MRYSILLLISLSFSTVGKINSALQHQLLSMAKQDQDIRVEVKKAGWNRAPKILLNKVKQIDQNNTRKLKSLLDGHTWFTKKNVGVDGVAAAFLILQHSPDNQFQQKMLPTLKASFLNNEGISGQDVALLTDRVLISLGRKQIYGTQADTSKGKVVFKPIKNRADVDKRRAQMHLPPLSFYKKILEKLYGIKEHPEIKLN